MKKSINFASVINRKKMKAKIEFTSKFKIGTKNAALLHVIYVGFTNPYLDGRTFHMISDNTSLHYFNTLSEAKKAFTKESVKKYFIKANITLY